MNDMDAMTFCDNFLTATEGKPMGVTAQSYLTACDTWAAGNSYPESGAQLDAAELARFVVEEIKGQLGNIAKPEIEGKYKLKHR